MVRSILWMRVLTACGNMTAEAEVDAVELVVLGVEDIGLSQLLTTLLLLLVNPTTSWQWVVMVLQYQQLAAQQVVMTLVVLVAEVERHQGPGVQPIAKATVEAVAEATVTGWPKLIATTEARESPSARLRL